MIFKILADDILIRNTAFKTKKEVLFNAESLIFVKIKKL